MRKVTLENHVLVDESLNIKDAHNEPYFYLIATASKVIISSELDGYCPNL